MKNIHAAEETLEKKEYKLYEYTQGLQLLSEYNAHEKTDPYLMNLFAFKENRAEELKKSGWLYEDGIELDEPEEGYWKNVLCKLPWTESVFSQWQKQANSSQQEDYLRALDHLCLAEKIDPDANASNRSKRAALTLKAVDILVQYYNDGNTGIPVALTLARGLNMLGKRGLAVEVMKSVLETNTLGKEDINIDLPFLLPLPEQDQSPVQTNFKQWLTVRIVEAWIQLKDVSTYFSGEEELKLLEKLEGNPENQSHLGKLVILMRQRKGKKYFSQFGEDIILEKLLKPQQAKGFYIDIGAFHPHKYSNTALMNLFGWSGINIDANEKAINTFNRVRPNDINLYAAITETDGEVEFFMADRLGEVNTLSNTHKEMWENRGITYKTKKVPSRRLDSLLSEHIDPTVAIDFMNIDVEDAEMGVLNSNDWTKYRPKVIAIEIIMHGPNEQTVYDSEVAGFLRDQGYKYITYKKLTAFFQDTSVQKPTLSVTGSNELSLNKTKNENVNRNSYLQKNIEEKDKILFDLLMDYEKRTGYMSEKLIFKKIHGYYPDLSNPKTFNEKVLYKKIFDRNPLLPKIADKLLVREYVKQKLGSEGAGILIPLLFHSKKPIEIPFESFEEDFIVKPNHSCGMYKMIQKGSKFDTNKLRNLCRHWLEIPHGIKAYEWAYQPINRKIIVEKLLLNENNKIPKDYKFFVFNGKCKWVKVDHDRFEHHTSTVYDENWNYLSVTRVNPKGVIEPKPIHFDVMKRYAEILGSELDFVRVDLYLVKSQIYFGELTNYPMSGRAIIKPKEWDVKLGNYWNINY
jgi:FkbM family methyltransferase